MQQKTDRCSTFKATGSFQAIRKTPVVPEKVHSRSSTKQSKSTSRSPRITAVIAVGLALIALAFQTSKLFDQHDQGKQHPSIATSSAPVALLAESPQIFAWTRDPAVIRPLFDPELEAYSIQKTTGHLFAIAGEQPAAPMLVKTTLNINRNWTGSAGIFWALRITNNQFQNQEQKCLALRYSRHGEGKPPRLRVDELTFSNSDGVEWKHSYTRPLDEIEVHIPTGNIAVLETRIEKQTLAVVFDGDQTWNPEIPTGIQTTWLPGGDCAMGITGQGNLVVISKLQVEAIHP